MGNVDAVNWNKGDIFEKQDRSEQLPQRMADTTNCDFGISLESSGFLETIRIG
jgi:hypothetical protein